MLKYSKDFILLTSVCLLTPKRLVIFFLFIQKLSKSALKPNSQSEGRAAQKLFANNETCMSSSLFTQQMLEKNEKKSVQKDSRSTDPRNMPSNHNLQWSFIFQLILFYLKKQNSINILQYDIKRRMGKKLLKKGEAPDQFQTELYDKITKIEAQVLQRIQKLKSNSKSHVCQHFNLQAQESQPYNQNVNYYDKFWKRFLLNEIGRQNVLQIREQLNLFEKKLNKIETLFDEREKELEPLTKNRRRISKNEENPQYFCSTCLRGYRDQETLMLHIKIKHRMNQASQLKRENNGQQIYEEENEDE